MRRLVSILLLVVFALPSSWAVAAAYCEHETAADAAHFGHHGHEHAAVAAAGAEPDSPTQSMTPDLDCHACHACSACLASSVEQPLSGRGGAKVHASPESPLPAPPVDPLDRPDWLSLA
jgi:hypothetical protein